VLTFPRNQEIDVPGDTEIKHSRASVNYCIKKMFKPVCGILLNHVRVIRRVKNMTIFSMVFNWSIASDFMFRGVHMVSFEYYSKFRLQCG